MNPVPVRTDRDMEVGVWRDAARQFYPIERLRAHGSALVDELDRRRLLRYIEPISGVAGALYTDATQCAWKNDALHLDTGEVVPGGRLRNPQGVIQPVAEPRQLFTRWHCFASTFPGCEVYGG